MKIARAWYLGAAVFGVAGVLAAGPLTAQVTVTIDADDIGGVVTGPGGPEAGVWVIAETTDLGTKFAKMVVTDDQGRYVLPDLPKAKYKVWVRGYGLVDSAKVDSEPGKTLNLRATPAPNAAAAAEYYPAIYWYSMIKVPEKGEFPGTAANGFNPAMKSQGEFLNLVKTNGCVTCHQLGSKATRTIPKALGEFKNGHEAWTRRIQSGQAGLNMVNTMDRMGTQGTLKMFGDWTDRVAKGELPATKPQRPQGVERNAVVTVWDWSNPKAYLHDATAADKRNPTLNANGLVFGATENSTDMVPVLDPVKNIAYEVKLPVRDPKTPSDGPVLAPSAYFGDEAIWNAQTSPHSLYYDEKGRVWFAARNRPPANPDFCKKGSDHPSAKVYPIDQANRQVTMYDPKSQKFLMVNTCFPTHHVQFGFDANNTLWASAGGPQSGAAGWINVKMLEETGDEAKSQGWTPFILDTNGNGKRDEWVEPDAPMDAAKDKRVVTGLYAVAVNPVDGTIWGTSRSFPGYVVRVNPGPDPTHTALTEIYEPPLPGYGPRGGDIDRNGVYWASLASGHLASFDRRKCKGPLNGPQATGKHCPEGWTLYPFPGPQFANVTESASAESSYYTWVDQFDTFGLGKNVPIATGNLNEGLLALVEGKFVVLRVPYPLGYYSKWLDGRIDDAKKGWKGRGLWSTVATRAPFHMEGGKGTRPKVVRFQLRPNPLAD